MRGFQDFQKWKRYQMSRNHTFDAWMSVLFPSWLSGKESACNAGDTGDAGSIPGSRWSLGGGNGKPLPYSLPEKSHGQRSLVAYSPRVAKSQTYWVTKHNTSSPATLITKQRRSTKKMPFWRSSLFTIPTKLSFFWKTSGLINKNFCIIIIKRAGLKKGTVSPFYRKWAS